MTTLAVNLYTPLGIQIAAIDTILDLAYARTINAVGSLVLTVPDTVPLNYFYRDGQIAIERNSALELETRWLITRLAQQRDGPRVTTVVQAVDGVDLLRRRIVDYAAGSAQAVKTDEADDLMKAVVRENLSSSATDTSRALSASLFAVAGNTSQGPSLSKAFSRRNVLTTLQELAQASSTAGTWMGFDVVWTGSLFEFRTYPQWRGVDHRFPGGMNPVILSAENGSLMTASYTTDYTEEITRAIAGGSGEEESRIVGRATDSTRASLSPYALVEAFVNASAGGGGLTQAAVDDEADAALREGRPRVSFACEINAGAPGIAYGAQYGWGDVVTAEAFGQAIDCRVDGVSVSWQAGRETISLTLRSGI